MDIVKFFQAIFNFPVSGEMVEAAAIGRGLQPTELIVNVSARDKDLVLADLLVMMSRVSQGYTNMTGSDHFSMTVRGDVIPIADRRMMLAEAESIYRRWDEGFTRPITSAINL